jgi:hypothetical protein
MFFGLSEPVVCVADLTSPPIVNPWRAVNKYRSRSSVILLTWRDETAMPLWTPWIYFV